MPEKKEDLKQSKEEVPKKDQDSTKTKENPEKKDVKDHEKPKKKYTPTLTDSKIKKLLDFKHLEELFYLLQTLDEKQVESFLKHYKDSDIKHTEDQKLERVMKSSETTHQLIENVKTEIAKSLTDEYDKIRENISSLRKKGSDLYIEDIKSLSTPGKIKMFKSTGSKDDFHKVKKSLHDLQIVVDETLKESEEKQAQEEKEKKAKEEKEKNKIAEKPEESPEKKEESKEKPAETPKEKEEEKPKEEPKEKPKIIQKDIKQEPPAEKQDENN
jgi:hypothetical protein